ncbi:hypothetical protein LZ31DRAFT_543944 [Colletotrichum somersetense]|nr:hypothetical protein LZ31DRAFT_543944 [Colletotrichum somersetense]
MSTGNEPASSDAAPHSFTLKDLTPSTWADHPLGRTAHGMKRAGFHRWGFVIYRATYNDDTAWERYLKALKLTARRALADEGGDVLLEHYMDWPVIADQPTLDGASKADVRKHFNSWLPANQDKEDYDELSNVVAVVIDGAFDKRTSRDDKGSYTDIKGCTERYVGWSSVNEPFGLMHV